MTRKNPPKPLDVNWVDKYAQNVHGVKLEDWELELAGLLLESGRGNIYLDWDSPVYERAVKVRKIVISAVQAYKK